MKQKDSRRQPQKKPSPHRQKPRKQEDGRPKGTLKRFPFDETRIGFMLRYEMPVVYHLLHRLCAPQQPFEPDWRVIESVAEASKDIFVMSSGSRILVKNKMAPMAMEIILMLRMIFFQS